MSDESRRSSSGRACSAACRALGRAFVVVHLLAVCLLAAAALRGLEPFVVGSGSMQPALDPGDLALIDPARTIQVGDVVAYVSGENEPRLHRVAHLAGDGLITTKGDTNPTADFEIVSPEMVLGVLHRTVPWVGLPTYWLRSAPWGFSIWLTAVAVVPLVARSTRARVRYRTGIAVGGRTVGALVVSATVAVAGAAYTASTVNAANSMSSSTWTTYRSVAMGDKHACAARFDRTVWCWGMNFDGQVGDNSTTDRLVPVQVVGAGAVGFLTDADRIVAGTDQSCALKVNATAWCWGQNDRGQLGDNTTTDRPAPTQVVGSGGVGTLTSVIALTAGGSHTCAIKIDTTVWCWGKNFDGQLGDNTTSDRSAPVQVVGASGSGVLTGAASITAGGSHTCVVKTDTSMWCWGRNFNAQIGNGATTDRWFPVQVVGPGGSGTLTSVASASAGGSHTCAVKVDGTVWCWGKNNNGQLGDNSTTERSSPVQVVGSGGVGFLTDVRLVDSSGKESTCVITVAWATWCWGNNPKSQVGDGTVVDRASPVRVVGAGGVGFLPSSELLGVGGEHACAVSSSDGFNCWGGNTRGQIGDGSTTLRATPVPALITP